MAPTDNSPHAGEIMQRPERVIPEPKPGEESDEPVKGNPEAGEREEAEGEPDIAQRPSLPQHDDGMKSLKKQRG
jgi:hypothetical protein